MKLSPLYLLSLSCLTLACASTRGDVGGSTSTDAGSMGPQFYRISGHGVSAYLFGTVHVDDERTRNLPDVVDEAFEESDALYVELAPTKEAVAEMMALASFPDDMTLDVYVGPELWARIEDRYESLGQPRSAAEEVKAMRPWAAASMIPSAEDRDDGPVLDRRFSLRAKEQGKVVRGLEHIREQVDSMIPDTKEEEVEQLSESLEAQDASREGGIDLTAMMLDAWSSGDPERLFSIPYPGADDPVKRAEVLGGMWKRNEVMTERLDEALRASPDEVAFVAVGALHLPNEPGTDVALEREGSAPRQLGMAELLRLRGYTVTRINASE